MQTFLTSFSIGIVFVVLGHNFNILQVLTGRGHFMFFFCDTGQEKSGNYGIMVNASLKCYSSTSKEES